MPTDGWRDIVGACAGVVCSLLVAEAAASHAFTPPPTLREADDAVAELAREAPDTLILGSSHARAFEGVRAALAAETRGAHRVLIVPLELGRLSSYRWLLEHRLAPLLDAHRAAGRPLRRMILVTHWWDECFADGEPAANLPARAWTLADFGQDAAAHGLTAHNRGYTSRRWQALTARSTILRVRGESVFVADDLLHALIGRPRAADAATDGWQRELRAVTWRAMIERGADDPRCQGRDEAAAREAILSFARSRAVELTMLLFPLMPTTVTARARRSTLQDFSARMAALAAERGHRLVDWTTSTPLTDDDFQRDLDHPSPSGVAKLAAFGLAGDLAFLRDPPPEARAP
jgi:hypothetical protein